jgi:hypothetical protein
VKKGRRLAVLSPSAAHLVQAEAALRARGESKRPSLVHVAPIGCEPFTELLFDPSRAERPDAVLLTDDTLVAPFLAGLARARQRPGRDVYVLAHGTWPCAPGAERGVEGLGFDAREILAGAKACLDAQRAGEPCAGRVVPPRFANELRPATSTSASTSTLASAA